MFFVSSSNRGNQGIYRWLEGAVEKVVDKQDLFDGRAPVSFWLWPHNVRGDDLVIQVNFDFQGTDAALYTTFVPDGSVAPVGPRIETIVVDRQAPLAPELRFQTEDGKRYQVRYSGDLAAWEWAATVITGDGATATWQDSGPSETTTDPATSPARFYQVVEQP